MDRKSRHKKIRKKIKGTKEKPRLSVYRSLKGIWAQIIDDDKGITLASASHKKIKKYKDKLDQARQVGILIAKEAKKKKIKRIVFDRGGYKYHGRIKELAEGAREGGLEF